MKKSLLIMLFLFFAFCLSAQEFSYRKSERTTYVKLVKHDSLIKPYRELGIPIICRAKNGEEQLKWILEFKEKVISQKIRDKIQGIGGYMHFYVFYDKQGKIIDVCFSILNTIFEKLDESDLRSIHNKVMKQKVNVQFLTWRDNGGYALLSFPFFNRKRSVQKSMSGMNK